MNSIAIILIVLIGIITLLLIVAMFSRKEYNVQRSIIINASKEKIFEFLKHLKNQELFNKWVMIDPNMKKHFRGVDGTVGFIYGWNGNKKAGEGEQEIKEIITGEKIVTEIRFVRPFAGIANVCMTASTITLNQTKVNWSNKSKVIFPMNIMMPIIEKMLSKDMDTSLEKLKVILEK